MKRNLWRAALASLFCGGAVAAVPGSPATSLPQAMQVAAGRWHNIITVSAAEMRPMPGRPVSLAAEAALKA
jgi:hypothetical protein